MRAHRDGVRGPLHPDEWCDYEVVVRQVETALGCTWDELREVYARTRGGPTPKHLRERKARLDAALAGVENLALLARMMGVPERKLQKAAQAARN